MKYVIVMLSMVLSLATPTTPSGGADDARQGQRCPIPVAGDSAALPWHRHNDNPDIAPDYAAVNISKEDSVLEYISSSLWTGIQDVWVENNYAYCAYVNGLAIIDVSDPGRPTPISNLYLRGGAGEVVKRDSILYLANQNGLTMINISNPAAPALIGEYPVPDGIAAIDINDSIVCAIISSDSADIILINVGDPAHPDSLSSFDSPGLPWDLAVAGHLVYVADDYDGLSIVDISDPSNPVLADNLPIPGISTGVAVNDTLALIVGDSLWVATINTSPPAIIGSAPFDIISGADCISLDVFARDTLVFVSYMEFFFQFNANLEIIDVSDPAHPVGIGNPLVDPTGFFPGGDVSYLIYGFPFYIEDVDRRKGLQIFDVGDLICLPPDCPAEPEPLGACEAPLRVGDIFAAGDYAYAVCDSSGLYVLDMVDPANPSIVGGYHDLPGQMSAIFVQGDVAYVTYHFSRDYLITVDISDPTDPVLLDSIETPGYAYDVFVLDTIAYIADGAPDLTTINAADPSELVVVDNIEIPGHGYAVYVRDTLACLADYFKGLAIFNVADPANLSFISNSPAVWEARDVFVQDNMAYLTEASYGIRLVDISDPTVPVMRGGYATPGTNLSLHVLGERAYVTDERQGLYLLDVADADYPVLIDGYDTPGYARAIFARDGWVYLGDYFSLIIFRDNGFPPSILCGDANNDDKVNVGDAVFLINYIFRDGAAPIPAVCAGDANGDGLTNVGDAVYLINYIFREGTAPVINCCP